MPGLSSRFNLHKYLLVFGLLITIGTTTLGCGSSKLARSTNYHTKSGPPNIIVIFMDDMGYGDIEAYGSIDYNTPNIDKLASEGMRFTNFYAVQPVCTVSRAGLLTGAYPNRLGMSGVVFPHAKTGLTPKEETIAELLKKQGYATGMVGKWHLGDAQKFLPLQQGFDMYFGLPYSNDMWPRYSDGTAITDTSLWQADYPPLPLIDGNQTIQYIQSLDDMSMLTTRYTQRANQFIVGHKQQPFFLYFAHSMPHVPLAVSDKFKGKSKQGIYGDVMMEIDWSVGQIMKTLSKQGLENNTLVIFTSDNGPWIKFGSHAGSTGGLRGAKTNTWEGGVREPTIMRWPDVISPGTVNNKIASTIDILPTIAALTDASLPKNRIDGVNILPLLKGKKAANPRDHLYYYFHKNNLQAVRKDHWKLVLPHDYTSYEDELPGRDGQGGKTHPAKTGLELYDLRRDPGERYNVIEQNPDIVTDIMQLVEKARADLGDANVGRPCSNCRAPGKVKNGIYPHK